MREFPLSVLAAAAGHSRISLKPLRRNHSRRINRHVALVSRKMRATAVRFQIAPIDPLHAMRFDHRLRACQALRGLRRNEARCAAFRAVRRISARMTRGGRGRRDPFKKIEMRLNFLRPSSRRGGASEMLRCARSRGQSACTAKSVRRMVRFRHIGRELRAQAGADIRRDLY